MRTLKHCLMELLKSLSFDIHLPKASALVMEKRLVRGLGLRRKKFCRLHCSFESYALASAANNSAQSCTWRLYSISAITVRMFRCYWSNDSNTTFKVKRSKVNLQRAGAYCGGLPHSLSHIGLTLMIIDSVTG